MWEVATGYCVKTYTGHRDWVRMVRVLPAFGRTTGSSGNFLLELFFVLAIAINMVQKIYYLYA